MMTKDPTLTTVRFMAAVTLDADHAPVENAGREAVARRIGGMVDLRNGASLDGIEVETITVKEPVGPADGIRTWDFKSYDADGGSIEERGFTIREGKEFTLILHDAGRDDRRFATVPEKATALKLGAMWKEGRHPELFEG